MIQLLLTRVSSVSELPEDEQESIFELFMEQFDDTLVKILLAAAVISFALAYTEEHKVAFLRSYIPRTRLSAHLAAGRRRPTDSIRGAVSHFGHPDLQCRCWRLAGRVNALGRMLAPVAHTLTLRQEQSAANAINALKEYAPAKAMVLRSGKPNFSELNAVDLVPGDIVEVRTGDKIPADLRLLELKSMSLRIDQVCFVVALSSNRAYTDLVCISLSLRARLCLSLSTQT